MTQGKAAAVFVSLFAHAWLVWLTVNSPQLSRQVDSTQTESRVPLIALVFFLQDSSAANEDRSGFQPTLDSQAIMVPVPVLPQINAIAADSFEESRAIESAEDLARAERLQGIYTKQIADRIRRVLQMGSVSSEAFSDQCIVRVIQNENGDVLDVDTGDCARPHDAREQLARAIRSASPLPSPPDGLAMGSYLTIDATGL